MNLAPIASPSLADAAEKHILEAIRQGELRPGDMLPGEQQLADQLGISRPVVREALSRLRMLGLLVSRKRRGMELAHPDLFEGLERVMDPVFLDEETMQELFEMRLILEMGLADLLFHRKTAQDMEELEGIVAKETAARAPEKRREFEIAFHSKLYRMANNRTLARFQALLRPFFERVKAAASGQSPVTHSDLLNILKHGNADTFRDAMRRHLTPHFNRILGAKPKA